MIEALLSRVADALDDRGWWRASTALYRLRNAIWPPPPVPDCEPDCPCWGPTTSPPQEPSGDRHA